MTRESLTRCCSASSDGKSFRATEAVKSPPVRRNRRTASAKTILAMTFAVATTLIFSWDSVCQSPNQPPALRAAAEPPKPAEPGQNTNEPPEPPLPEDALRRFGSMAWRHNGGIRDATLSLDGKTLVTCGERTLAVWDTATGRRKQYLRDFEYPKIAANPGIVVAPDGRWVASFGNSNVEVRAWDVASGKQRWTYLKETEPKRAGPGLSKVRHLFVSPDGKELLISDEEKVRVLDASNGNKIRTIQFPGRIVAMSQNGVISATHNPTDPFVVFCDSKSGMEIGRTTGALVGNGEELKSISAAFSPDDKLLATHAGGGEVRLWSLATNAGGGKDRLWNAATGQLVKTLKHTKNRFESDLTDKPATVVFSRDGKMLFTSIWSSVLRWGVASGKELPPFDECSKPIDALLPMPDEKTLLTCTDVTIHRWDVARGKLLVGPKKGFSRNVTSLLSPDAKTVVTADRSSDRLEIWSVASGKWITRLETKFDFLSSVSVSFTPDGRYLLAQNTGNLDMFDTSNWKSKKVVALPSDASNGLKSIAGGKILMNDGGNWSLFELGAKEPLWNIELHSKGLAVSPDSTVFATRTNPGISLRRVADGKELRAIPIETRVSQPCLQGYEASLTFSSDGKWLAAKLTMYDREMVSVWDSHTGGELWRLSDQDDQDTRSSHDNDSVVAFSSDDRWLASGHTDGTIRIWDMASGQEVRRLVGHDAPITSVCFAPDGRTIVSSAGVEVLQWRVPPKLDSKADKKTLWDDLAADDGAKAFRAIWSLVSQGKRSMELLESKIKPMPPPDEHKLAQMIADLDNDLFSVRDKASMELANFGSTVEKYLRDARSKNPSPEVVRRIDELLNRISQPPQGKELHLLRGIQVIESIGGDEAKRLLRRIAEGEPGGRLTAEAQKSLGRLK
jgi:WD40 repeat protein